MEEGLRETVRGLRRERGGGLGWRGEGGGGGLRFAMRERIFGTVAVVRVKLTFLGLGMFV